MLEKTNLVRSPSDYSPKTPKDLPIQPELLVSRYLRLVKIPTAVSCQMKSTRFIRHVDVDCSECTSLMRWSEILDVTKDDGHAIEQIATLLMEGFNDAGITPWPTMDEAINEVRESLQPGRISRMAISKDHDVFGWIGGIEQYNGNVWELHPLIVHQDCRRRGLGRRLVADFEQQVAKRGGHTMWLGTDDENCGTTVGGIDLYPGVLDKLRAIENRGVHPFKFYVRVGFHIVGIIPDANGFGKPDILMAKRVSPDFFQDSGRRS